MHPLSPAPRVPSSAVGNYVGRRTLVVGFVDQETMEGSEVTDSVGEAHLTTSDHRCHHWLEHDPLLLPMGDKIPGGVWLEKGCRVRPAQLRLDPGRDVIRRGRAPGWWSGGIHARTSVSKGRCAEGGQSHGRPAMRQREGAPALASEGGKQKVVILSP